MWPGGASCRCSAHHINRLQRSRWRRSQRLEAQRSGPLTPEVAGSSPPRRTMDRQLLRDQVEKDGTAAPGLLAVTQLQRGARRREADGRRCGSAAWRCSWVDDEQDELGEYVSVHLK